MWKILLLVVFIPFLACTTTHTIGRGVITEGAAGTAGFVKQVYGKDTCWVADSTEEEYHVKCR